MTATENKASRPVFHGSDIEQIEKYYHINKDDIILFGANVNPLGLSPVISKKLAQNLDVITRYPDRDYKDLKKAISNYTGARTEHIVVGNGSTELISLLISHRNAKHALLVGPTYSEYERELELTGGDIQEFILEEQNDFRLNFDSLEEVCKNNVDFLILCNPNNPTSSAITRTEMHTLLSMCKKYSIFVMIDETYVEFAPVIEDITAMSLVEEFDNFMIIRGVSKFYAAPGLRLGYGVTSNTEFLKTLKKYQNPWSLNSIGAYVGELLFQDHDYYSRTRDLILSEREKCIYRLQNFRYAKVYPAYANFILVKILKADLTSDDVFDHVIRKGFMIRNCSSFEALDGEFIRFCIMNPEDNERLLDSLEEILN